jgi:predicted ribosome quality control (RQC) complex YloA/Tae2 family protein
MWIVNEFHVPNEDDEYDFLWDVNLWTILLEADELHRKTGMVHFAFFERLKSYQESRGGGSPRVYRKAALAVLLAECFEDFNQYGLKAQINDHSKDTDPMLPKPSERYRKPFYTSTFADFLIKFCEIIEFDEKLSRDDHSLDKYRQILRKRIDQNAPRISERLASSLKAQEVSEILEILDQIKR